MVKRDNLICDICFLTLTFCAIHPDVVLGKKLSHVSLLLFRTSEKVWPS